ncbi:MAG: helix-turn-helix transcriptional regulator [Saprospiraceae bacterium]|nr:helix-turn-helix transcriptional regulator [Saprospiraceae bacterium]
MESTRIEQGARLQQLIKALKTNQTGFADLVNVSQSNINKMVRGVKGISKTVINGLLLGHKNVNVHWLLTGEGEMFLRDLTAPVDQVAEDAAAYGKRPLLLGEVEGILEAQRREIEALKARVARLETLINSFK